MSILSTSDTLPNAFPVRRTHRAGFWVVGVGVILGLGICLALWGSHLFSGKTSANHSDQPQIKSTAPTVVEVVHPRGGGIERLCIQPGSVEPFESADLYAKVSGFLMSTVDIGTRVNQGDLLAQISVPEYEQQVKRDEAVVERQQAAVKRSEARLSAIQAEAKAAGQLIKQSEIELKSKSVYRSYRSKSLERIKLLFKEKSIEAVILDQETDHYEAAVEAENAAREAVETSRLKADAAKAREAEARAEIEDAKAQLDVVRAELARWKVLLDYTFIRSPYKGVVTKRNFNRGDFIRAADAGGDRVPIVAVDRTDKMRIVVQVPDRDVPFVDKEDPATVEIDALPGHPFKGEVARAADSEDKATRTMRTEIDISNEDGKLRRNMYGRVKLTLEKPSPDAMRVPSAAIVARGTAGLSFVRVIRNHQAHFVQVDIGQDTGAEVEILRGLQLTDEVIVAAKGPLAEGTEVTTEVTPEPETDDSDS